MNIEPLNSDPKRQASDVISGFYYQILHSVFAWLDLREEEVLYLEGGEDFDVVRQEAATATQVKSSKKSITLRSNSVLDAIFHCWELGGKNKEREVSLRFITSAKIGKEKGGPFGKGIAGLELWQLCQRDSAILEKIIEFLTSQSSFPRKFLEFLKEADSETVLKKVIQPIQWLTEDNEADYVQQAIERKLVFHGDKLGIGPRESIAVIPRLKEVAWEKASLPNLDDRSLDRELFLRVFEDATMITVPRSLILSTGREKRADVLTALEPSLIGNSDINLVPKPQTPVGVPSLQSNFFNRESLISDLQSQLKIEGVLVLSGSSGMGKSTIAKLIAQLDKDRGWLWLNFSGRKHEQLLQTLQNLGRFIDEDTRINSIVLDDVILTPGIAREIEDYFGGLLFTIINRGGTLMITSQRQIPGRLSRQLSLNDAKVIDVPPFIEDEIALFAEQLGCQDAELAKNWAKIIFMHTKGHPQLVHAHLLHLKNVKWPEIKQEDLLSPPTEVIDERKEARSLLLRLDNEQRELLYRLSVVKGPFRRDQAISIGGNAPPIQYPGDAFDLSIGPWVESLDEEYFLLSPLLENAAEEVWSSEVLKSLYASTAQNILSCGELTLIEASNVFFNAWRGKADDILVGVIGSLMHARGNIWDSVIEEMSWLIHLYHKKDSFYPDNHLINFMFRNLQFNIAVDIRPDIAAHILSVWETEIVDHEPRESFLLENFLFNAQAITHYKVDLSSAKLLTHILQIISIQSDYQKLTKKSLFESLPLDSLQNLASEYFLFVIARCKSKEYLESLLENLKKIPAEIRLEMLGAFNSYYSLTMINSVWMREVDQEDPDWENCESIFEKTLELAIAWNAYDLAIAAIRGIAIIKDEYLNNAAGALEFINKYQKQYISYFLKDEESSIYFGMEQYAKTLEICEAILPDWEPLVEFHDYTTIFSYRKAGISAAKLEDWQKSGSLFQDGAERANLLIYPISHAALFVDASYSFYKAHSYPSMLHALKGAFQVLENLSEQEEGINVRKVASHYLLWIFTNVIGEHEAGLAEPAAGKCSDPTIKNDADLETIPLMPFDLVWPTLAVIEHTLGIEAGLYDIALPFKHSKYSMARRYVIEVEIGRSIRDQQFEGFPGKCVSWIKEMQFTHQEQINKGKHPWEPDACSPEELNMSISTGLLTIALMSGLIVLAAENNLNHKLIKTWEDDVALQNNEALSRLLRRADEILFSLNTQEIVPMINNSKIAVEERIFAALRGSLGDITKPEDVLNANYAFVHPLLDSIWLDDISDHLCTILANQWLRMTQFKGQFSAPILTVPELEAACAGLETGVCKLQNIFLAAADATPRKRLPDDFVSQLRTLCDKQSRLPR